MSILADVRATRIDGGRDGRVLTRYARPTPTTEPEPIRADVVRALVQAPAA